MQLTCRYELHKELWRHLLLADDRFVPVCESSTDLQDLHPVKAMCILQLQTGCRTRRWTVPYLHRLACCDKLEGPGPTSPATSSLAAMKPGCDCCWPLTAAGSLPAAGRVWCAKFAVLPTVSGTLA